MVLERDELVLVVHWGPRRLLKDVVVYPGSMGIELHQGIL